MTLRHHVISRSGPKGWLPGVLRILRCRRGAMAVEFALILPIFLVMVLGIVEVGRAMWIKTTMQFICEESTRYAMVNEDMSTAAIETYAQTALSNAGFGNYTVTFTATQDLAGGVTFMTVSATHDYQPLVSIIGLSAVTLTASSRTAQNN